MYKRCCDICEREILSTDGFYSVCVIHECRAAVSSHKWNKELCESCFNALETFLEDLRNGKSISD